MKLNRDLSVGRRAFFGQASWSLGTLTLASWGQFGAGPAVHAATSQADGTFNSTGVVQAFHVPPKIRRVIFLYMSGGPSQFETLDHKPELSRWDGQPIPESYTQGQPIAQLQGQKLVCLRPLVKFQRWGQSGQEISELFPHLGSVADELCIVRSMHTDQINHDPAHTVMNTGTSVSGRPSMGAWVLYGLGNASENLPGFVVLTSQAGRSPQPISNRMWHNGFLPGRYQGVKLQTTGEPVNYLSNPPGVTAERQRDVIDATRLLNRARADLLNDPEVETRISQYEMAFRMQMGVPELVDISDEPEHILKLYGAKGIDGSFAGNCLLARRLAERGVRFIQVYHRDWDHHNNLLDFIRQCAGLCDGPSAALLRDLKQRGMLQDTLVIWSGEFGRTPMAQTNKGAAGRDHHMKSFSLWMAGGGIRPGITYGATDELGYNAVENPVHVHDLHATMLHLLGIDHQRLTFRTQGRDFRLTDIAGRVLRELLV